jgi:hypothetical protein
MPVDTLLTRLEVTPKGELYTGFRDLGGIYFPDWKHLFPSKILGTKYSGYIDENPMIQDLENKIKSNKYLNRYKTRKKSKYWHILQWYGPISLKNKLPKEFIRGNYTKEARWRFTNPGSIISLDEKIIEVLQKSLNIEKRLDNIKECVSEGKKKANATRIWNDLDEFFDNYDGNNFAEIKRKAKKSILSLDDKLIEKRKKISDLLIRTNKELDSDTEIVYKKTKKNKRDHELRIEKKDTDFLKKSRTPTLYEFLSYKWLFMDIEEPLFMEKDSKVTWVGIKFIEKDKEVSEMYTIHDVGKEKIEGYNIKRFENEKELISSLTARVKQLNPDIISTYNTRYDLIRLRESQTGFEIGEKNSNPKYEATLKFFERIGIKDRLIIDLMRWQKIARPYEINAKLETAAGFEKSISYKEMADLEKISLAGDTKISQIIAKYLAIDVDSLFKLYQNQGFRKNLEDALWVCDKYNIGIERIMHTLNSFNNTQEYLYFKNLGIFRENVPPNLRTKKMQAKKGRAKEIYKERLNDLIKQEETKGLFKNVYKVAIPVSQFLKQAITRRFPEIKELYDYSNRYNKDKKRYFFINQILLAACDFMITDHGFSMMEHKKLDNLIKGIDNKEFEDIYHDFRNSLSWKEKNKLNKAQLPIKSTKDIINNNSCIKEFLERYNLSEKKFTKIANQRSMIKRVDRRIIGNYDVFPNRRFFRPEKKRDEKNIKILDEIINNNVERINYFLEKNNLKVVSKEGYYIYLIGNKKALEKRDAPLILLDEIDRLYNADNVYYKKFGFTSNLKNKEKGDYHLCKYEMNVYNGIVNNLIFEKNKEAESLLESCLNNIESMALSDFNLFYHNKNKDRFFAYTTDSKLKTGKTHFVLKDKLKKEEKKILFDEEKQLNYYKDKERNREVKVYVLESIDKLKIDYRKYYKRIKKRGKAILNPVIQKI